MNELTLFDQQYMTTKEVAETLEVSISTIQKIVRDIFDPSFLNTRVINGGEAYVYDAEQVTLIKQELQKNHRVSNVINSVSTELEENQTILKAIAILQNRNNFLKTENIRLTKDNTQLKATNGLLLADKSLFTPTQIAKELGKPVKGFKEWLHAEGYIYFQHGGWLPYHEYNDCFTSKNFVTETGYEGMNLYVTQKGRLALLKKYSKGVANCS